MGLQLEALDYLIQHIFNFNFCIVEFKVFSWDFNVVLIIVSEVQNVFDFWYYKLQVFRYLENCHIDGVTQVLEHGVGEHVDTVAGVADVVAESSLEEDSDQVNMHI